MFVLLVGIAMTAHLAFVTHAAQQRQTRTTAREEDSTAHYRLGVEYDLGRGVAQDYGKAATNMRQAAEEGDSKAYRYLGSFYRLGSGVPQDYVQSYFWFYLAASTSKAGGTNAVSRDEAASHLTRPVLLATQERARKWLEAHPSN
jgi:TPR repeat protein